MLTKIRPQPASLKDREHAWVPKPEPRTDMLYNEQTFYQAFTKDMLAANREVIIYSPFVSKYRSEQVIGAIAKLKNRNVDVFIFTRPVDEYERRQQDQIRAVLASFEDQGAFVTCLRGTIHEKVAIIDRETVWEGSLNILSQRSSREMMRRTESESMAMQVISYLNLQRSLMEGYKVKYERLYRSLMGSPKPKRTFKRPNIFFILGFGWLLFAILDIVTVKDVEHLISAVKLFTSH
jgi:phosphatidylserine/phosphatidylglycerophosphate/cardiolipin synthase-like enzyme